MRVHGGSPGTGGPRSLESTAPTPPYPSFPCAEKPKADQNAGLSSRCCIKSGRRAWRQKRHDDKTITVKIIIIIAKEDVPNLLVRTDDGLSAPPLGQPRCRGQQRSTRRVAGGAAQAPRAGEAAPGGGPDGWLAAR